MLCIKNSWSRITVDYMWYKTLWNIFVNSSTIRLNNRMIYRTAIYESAGWEMQLWCEPVRFICCLFLDKPVNWFYIRLTVYRFRVNITQDSVIHVIRISPFPIYIIIYHVCYYTTFKRMLLLIAFNLRLRARYVAISRDLTPRLSYIHITLSN